MRARERYNSVALRRQLINHTGESSIYDEIFFFIDKATEDESRPVLSSSPMKKKKKKNS